MVKMVMVINILYKNKQTNKKQSKIKYPHNLFVI